MDGAGEPTCSPVKPSQASNGSPPSVFGRQEFKADKRNAIWELLQQKLGKEHLATRPGIPPFPIWPVGMGFGLMHLLKEQRMPRSYWRNLADWKVEFHFQSSIHLADFKPVHSQAGTSAPFSRNEGHHCSARLL